MFFLAALPYGLKIISNEKSQYSDSYHLEWQVESVAPLIECHLNVHEVRSHTIEILANKIVADLKTKRKVGCALYLTKCSISLKKSDAQKLRCKGTSWGDAWFSLSGG